MTLGHDHILVDRDRSRCQKGIASYFDILRLGCRCEFLGFFHHRAALALEIESASKAQDEHLEADLMALFDRSEYGGFVRCDQMHHQRVFGYPWCDAAKEFSDGQARSFAIERILDQYPSSVRTPALTCRDDLSRSKIRTDLKQAGSLLLVIDLGVIIRIGDPTIRSAIGSLTGHPPKGHFGFDMEVRWSQSDAQRVDL